MIKVSKLPTSESYTSSSGFGVEGHRGKSCCSDQTHTPYPLPLTPFTSAFTIIAGPCAVEDEDSLRLTAQVLKENGVQILRGGCFKLRTSPHSFQGLGKEAVKILSSTAKEYDLLSLSEVTATEDIDFLHQHIDIFLVGTRNMHNYPLLKEIGRTDKPVILKRGMAATAKEWLLAAEYIAEARSSQPQIILCERGIRTFETCTRNTLDLATAVYVAQNSPYPVIADPSHATGVADLVIPMTLASRAAGLAGAMIEVHPHPEKALSDNHQMLNFEQFKNLMKQLEKYGVCKD